MLIRAGWAAGLCFLVVLPGAAGCHSSSSASVVIGYALPYRSNSVLPVVRAEVGRWADSGRVTIRFAMDSARSEDAPDVEVKRAEQMAAMPGIVGVVGHSSSRGSLVAAPVYNEARIVQITATSTSRLLRTVGPWTFNLAPDDSAEGAFIGGFVQEWLRARRVSLFFVNDEYGRGLRDGVVAELQRRGVGLTDQIAMDIQSDFPTLVAASLARGKPDAVVVAGRQRETGSIARLLRENGVPRAVVGGDGALVLPVLPEVAGSAADSIYVVAFWLPGDTSSQSRAFVAEYGRLVGAVPQPADAMTYDALLLLATAVRTVGPKPEAVRRYLEELGRGWPPYAGVTGPIRFAGASRPRLLMTRLRSGQPQRLPWP
jgi:branched-chain amino acid transport system substrate-binding protein